MLGFYAQVFFCIPGCRVSFGAVVSAIFLGPSYLPQIRIPKVDLTQEERERGREN
jgi:hypothetical protein